MDLSIKMDKRSKGFYYHRVPHGLNVNKAKSEALKDISKSEMVNFIPMEYAIVKYLRRYNETEQNHTELI